MALCSAFSKVLVPPTPGDVVLPPPPTANKNWNPGNYIGATSSGIADWTKTNGIYNRLLYNNGVNNWMGAMLRFQWDDLERAQGEYAWEETIGGKVVRKGMYQIDDCLAQIAGINGKRLIIFFQVKTFDSADNSVPAYMRTSSTYADTTDPGWAANGVYQYSGSGHGQYGYIPPPDSPNPNGGYVPNMHITAVRERFKALMLEFATRYNGNPNLECIAFSEASINKPVGSPTTWTPTTTWFNNMTNAYAYMRTNMSNIQICQWINSDRDDMEWWVPDIVAEGIGLGMPDMAKDTKSFCYTPTNSPNTGPGNIYWMNQYPNTAIRMGHASKPTLESTVMNTSQTVLNASPGTGAYPGVSWSRQDCATWSKANAAVTHRVWAHNTGSHSVSTLYNGQNYNTVTENWIRNGASDISVNETRPTGW